MNSLDSKIKEGIREKIEIPLSYEYAIKKAFMKPQTKKYNRLLRASLTTACLAMISTGVVVAGSIISKSIWKDPIIINDIEKNEKVSKIISDEERKDYISEEKAIEIGNEIIKKLGYKNIKVSNIELKRGYDSTYSGHYILRTEKLLINLNPIDGRLEYFGNPSVINKNIKCDEINNEKANNIANEISNKLNLFKNDTDYKIIATKKIKIYSGDKANDFWQVSYAKLYNGKYDETNISTICFNVYNGDIIIYSITARDNENFDNNPVILSEDEAIEIAKNKEKEFSNLELSSVNANLDVKKINVFVYCLENNLTNENGELNIDNILRNVWVVNIKHSKDEKPKDAKLETVKNMYDKKYYIDATTGEIVGGEQSEFEYN